MHLLCHLENTFLFWEVLVGGLAVLSISSMDGGETRADTPWWGGGEGTVPCSPRGRSGGVGCTLAIVL